MSYTVSVSEWFSVTLSEYFSVKNKNLDNKEKKKSKENCEVKLLPFNRRFLFNFLLLFLLLFDDEIQHLNLKITKTKHKNRYYKA